MIFLNGQYIAWDQVRSLYQQLSTMYVNSGGLTLLPKLKLEHVNLTSFSCLRMDLAAQVSVVCNFVYDSACDAIVGTEQVCHLGSHLL